MDFTVPQFINKEPKIIGPLTFKQFLYFLIAGGLVLFSHFAFSKKNPKLHYSIVVVAVLVASTFAFLKIKGISLEVFLKRFFTFTISSKIFIWRRKIMPPKTIKFVSKEETAGKEPLLKVSEKSGLQKLSTQVETKKR